MQWRAAKKWEESIAARTPGKQIEQGSMTTNGTQKHRQWPISRGKAWGAERRGKIQGRPLHCCSRNVLGQRNLNSCSISGLLHMGFPFMKVYILPLLTNTYVCFHLLSHPSWCDCGGENTLLKEKRVLEVWGRKEGSRMLSFQMRTSFWSIHHLLKPCALTSLN